MDRALRSLALPCHKNFDKTAPGANIAAPIVMNAATASPICHGADRSPAVRGRAVPLPFFRYTKGAL